VADWYTIGLGLAWSQNAVTVNALCKSYRCTLSFSTRYSIVQGG